MNGMMKEAKGNVSSRLLVSLFFLFGLFKYEKI